MLQNLHVKNLALIDELEVEFESGLNILTGETGAGKSIILGSINLALGGKYSPDMLRKGADYGFVELTFQVQNSVQIKEMETLDIIPEQGMIVLSRKLMENRSISKINGETVNMKTLKSVADILIDIHGQHEHQSLLEKKSHLTILDIYANSSICEIKSKLKNTYNNYVKCREEFELSIRDEESRKRETDFLKFEINEIESAKLLVEEDVELELQYKRMVNSKKLTQRMQETYQSTGELGDVNASECISRGIKSLQDIVELDDNINEMCQQLIQIDGLLNDFNRELSEYSKDLEFSQEEYQIVEERLNLINHLKAKYGNSIEEILAYYEKHLEKLNQLINYDQYIEKLHLELKEIEYLLEQESTKLSQIRQNNAKDMVKEIRQGLLELNFKDVKFDMIFNRLNRYTSQGVDEAEFYVSLNKGEPMKALTKVASGGELSRIMLVIKTILAEHDDIGTLIFDEIDVGISGITAGKVAEKMETIGKSHQIICITHLPQIAAMADTHYAIQKKLRKNNTITEIKKLNYQESIQELTRILGGDNVTESLRQSALEMKELAKSTK